MLFKQLSGVSLFTINKHGLLIYKEKDMRNIYLSIVTLLIVVPAFGQWSLEAETGLAFQSYNDVRIPNDEGTTFSFTDDFEPQGPLVPFRLRLGYQLGERNHFFALYAPLTATYEGPAPFDIAFQNSVFEEGEFIEGFYKFNSYRLTYRRDLVKSEPWTLALGFTAKIRDARVKLSTENKTDKKDDLGFVPLLHLFIQYRPNVFAINLEGDGLAGGPGRAFDVSLTGMYSITRNLHLKAGYRLVEGGADVSEVYNFTWINYATVGLLWEINMGE